MTEEATESSVWLVCDATNVSNLTASGRSAKLIIPGKPMTWARVQANFNKGKGKPVFRTAADRVAKMEEIKYHWKVAGHGLLVGPLVVQLEFIFRRPNAHFNSHGNIFERHRYDRPGRGQNGGDIDNLVKLPLDALNTVAYDDDLQIADLHARKRFAVAGETPETRLVITELMDAPEIDPDQLSLEAAAFEF